MLNRWTPNNKNTDVPRRNIQDQAATNYSSDRWLTSSNYLSLQNITFGYTLPKTLTRKIQIDGIRVYFVADNVALLTARKGMDRVRATRMHRTYIHQSAQSLVVFH